MTSAQPAVDNHPRTSPVSASPSPPSPERRISDRARRDPGEPEGRHAQQPAHGGTDGLPVRPRPRHRGEHARDGRLDGHGPRHGPLRQIGDEQGQLPHRTGRVRPRDPLLELAVLHAPLGIPGSEHVHGALPVGVRGEHRRGELTAPRLRNASPLPFPGLPRRIRRLRHGHLPEDRSPSIMRRAGLYGISARPRDIPESPRRGRCRTATRRHRRTEPIRPPLARPSPAPRPPRTPGIRGLRHPRAPAAEWPDPALPHGRIRSVQ